MNELNERLRKYGRCEDCQQPNTGTKWCNPCNAEKFKNGFHNWTSGKEEIDNFIREIQLKANNLSEIIEWIPFDQFEKVEYLARGGFSTVYKATWVNGYIKWWNHENQRWTRSGEDSWDRGELVCLKSLNNSAYMTKEFFQEIKNQLKFRNSGNVIAVYGITKDPEKQNYMMVVEYAREGSLRNILDKNYNALNWEKKLHNLLYIANGLSKIHKAGLVHKDFHSGNIVMNSTSTSITSYASYITDFGLCKPIQETTSKEIYGVLPYVAPEVLKKKEYTQASDVYSFGIIMTEVLTGYPPYHNIPHDQGLAMRICEGLRPKIRHQIPRLLWDLINRCLDAEPNNRISAEELKNILDQYYKDVFKKDNEIYEQIKSIEASPSYSPNYDPNESTKLSYTTHPHAFFTSRRLDFGSLPDPINATAAETKQLELQLDDLIIDEEEE